MQHLQLTHLFLISATLSSYLTFKDMEKCRIFYFYVSRYLRLAPLCYIAIFVAFKVLVHFSQGSMWHSPDLNCLSVNLVV